MADKIMLLDGNSLINRGFYAIPLLTNKNGEYTNGVYGFFNIFFKLLDDEKPQKAVVCFDLPKPTFRHLKYEAYKGTRKGMPEELRPQLPLLKKLLSAMNISIMELEGYEADDLLGSLAVLAKNKDLEPVIVSGDRDLLQLADVARIKIPKTKGGTTVVEDYTANEVLEKYGVTPKAFIEVKALMGDTSDNVPGVLSIGEKTATKIIQQYNTVENAIENALEIKPKKASENLIAFKEQALLSKWLVTINTQAPLEINFDNCLTNNIYNQQAFELFKEYEFKSMLSRFNVIVEKENKNINHSYTLVNTLTEAERLINDLNPFEPVSYKLFKNDDGVCISVCQREYEAYLINLSIDDFLKTFKGFFESPCPKITHDGKSDIVFLKRHNIELKGIVFDTMLAYYILDSNKSTYDYNDIAQSFLNENYPDHETVFGKGKNERTVKQLINLGDKTAIDYCCAYSDVSLRAKSIMENKIEELNQHQLYYEIELPLIYVLADMEYNGILVNKEMLIKYSCELDEKINELTQQIYWLAGEEFNINSPKQLSVILFEKLGLKGGKKTKTGWSTSADVLEKLKDKDEIVAKILEYRTYAKLKTTYADGLLNVMDKTTGKIYSTFNQTITSTGRISSTEPNLQNIPIKLELGRKLRKVFEPEKDYVFLDGDYSQIELRVLAYMANDETLINAFKEGQDIHRLTASQVFNVPFDMVTSLQRSNAKAVNFGIVYGIGAFSLSQDLGITKKEADAYIEGYFTKYPGVKAYMTKMVEDAHKNGYATTIFNRIRYIPEISSSNFNLRSFGERVAMNMPVQGSAADIIKIAMLRVYKALKDNNLKSRLILQVHDELLLEVYKPELEQVKEILVSEMENAVKLSVPLEVDAHIGETWYDAK